MITPDVLFMVRHWCRDPEQVQMCGRLDSYQQYTEQKNGCSGPSVANEKYSAHMDGDSIKVFELNFDLITILENGEKKDGGIY